MPRYFERDRLNDEQKGRWNAAMVEYDRILRSNQERALGKTLADEEWSSLVKGGDAILLGRQPGNPKSALFHRLLDGKAPLPFAPPLSFSYPWYESVEQTGPTPIALLEPMTEQQRAHFLQAWNERLQGSVGIGMISINQSPWTVHAQNGDAYVISYGEWGAHGYRWRASRVDTPAAVSASFICCWHDKAKPRITTRDELRAEAAWHVMQQVDAMRKVLVNLDPEPDGDTRSDEYAWRVRQARLAAEQRMIARCQQGLPAVPSESEIAAQIDAAFEHYLAGNRGFGRWVIDSNGVLHHRGWQLEMIARGSVDR